MVYVDSLPMGDGGLINDELPVENGEVPLPDWSLFDQEDLVDLPDGKDLGGHVRSSGLDYRGTANRKNVQE